MKTEMSGEVKKRQKQKRQIRDINILKKKGKRKNKTVKLPFGIELIN